MATKTEQTSLLKLTNTKVFKKFLHQCVDELAGKEHEIFNNTMDDIEWSTDEHKTARNFIHKIYKTNIFEEEFTHNLNELSNAHVEEIKNCFMVRKTDIYRAVVREQLLQSGIPLVENIDWKLKWVMGSSKLASISEPVLQVDLNCIQNDKLLQENDESLSVQFEIDLNQMNSLIDKLEHIKLQL